MKIIKEKRLHKENSIHRHDDTELFGEIWPLESSRSFSESVEREDWIYENLYTLSNDLHIVADKARTDLKDIKFSDNLGRIASELDTLMMDYIR